MHSAAPYSRSPIKITNVRISISAGTLVQHTCTLDNQPLRDNRTSEEDMATDPTEEMPSLADAITSVRSELERSRQLGSQQAIQFEVGSIEMDFDVVLTRTKGIDGVDVKVVSSGAKWIHETA